MITLIALPAFKGSKIETLKAIIITLSLDGVFLGLSQLI